jgi:hypothetical protein
MYSVIQKVANVIRHSGKNIGLTGITRPNMSDIKNICIYYPVISHDTFSLV